MYTEILFEYYLNHNYGKVEVTSTFEQDHVGVINQQGDLEHAIYDGEVPLKNALIIDKNGVGILTQFFGSPGYRKLSDDSWEFVCAPDVMACLLIRGNCYSILENDKPYICSPGDKNYLTIKRHASTEALSNGQGNVVTLADFRRTTAKF